MYVNVFVNNNVEWFAISRKLLEYPSKTDYTVLIPTIGCNKHILESFKFSQMQMFSLIRYLVI